MTSRNAIIFLLSLTLVSSGCATGTYQARSGATPVFENQIGQSRVSQEAPSLLPGNQSASFGLLSRSATVFESADVPSQPDRPAVSQQTGQEKTSRRVAQRGGNLTRAKRILSVGYQEDGEERSSGGSKIDFSAVEDTESNTHSLDEDCCSSEEARDDAELSADSSRDSSPPPTLPFENDFSPTAWTGVTIGQVREMAYEYHPVTARAQAKVDALRGRYQQAGLPNNPRIGVNADDVNEDGRAGRWGVQFGRQVTRRGKRQSDQAIVCAEIDIATEELNLAQRRLDTDVATRFYDCMVAQEQLAMARRMQDLAGRATELSRKLFAAEEVARSAVLQAELELEKANVNRKRLENRHRWAKRQLAALLGREDLPTEFVGGSIGEVALEEDFEATYDRLLKHSPELSVLFADIERSRRVASRQRLETLSDITWQTTLQYDTTENNVIGGFQATWQIPTLNQNQGAIYEAERNIAISQHTADIKALDIRQRLTTQWQQYLDAKLQVDAFRDSILPKSQEAMEILMKGYEVGETELLEVLMAQRTFFQTQVAYLENVRSLSRQNARIQGMLLGDSLSQ